MKFVHALFLLFACILAPTFSWALPLLNATPSEIEKALAQQLQSEDEDVYNAADKTIREQKLNSPLFAEAYIQQALDGFYVWDGLFSYFTTNASPETDQLLLSRFLKGDPKIFDRPPTIGSHGGTQIVQILERNKGYLNLQTLALLEPLLQLEATTRITPQRVKVARLFLLAGVREKDAAKVVLKFASTPSPHWGEFIRLAELKWLVPHLLEKPALMTEQLEAKAVLSAIFSEFEKTRTEIAAVMIKSARSSPAWKPEAELAEKHVREHIKTLYFRSLFDLLDEGILAELLEDHFISLLQESDGSNPKHYLALASRLLELKSIPTRIAALLKNGIGTNAFRVLLADDSNLPAIEKALAALVKSGKPNGETQALQNAVSAGTGNGPFYEILHHLDINKIIAEWHDADALPALLEQIRARPTNHSRYEQRLKADIETILAINKKQPAAISSEIESATVAALIDIANAGNLETLNNVLWSWQKSGLALSQLKEFTFEKLKAESAKVRKAVAKHIRYIGAIGSTDLIVKVLKGAELNPAHLGEIKLVLLSGTFGEETLKDPELKLLLEKEVLNDATPKLQKLAEKHLEDATNHQVWDELMQKAKDDPAYTARLLNALDDCKAAIEKSDALPSSNKKILKNN